MFLAVSLSGNAEENVRLVPKKRILSPFPSTKCPFLTVMKPFSPAAPALRNDISTALRKVSASGIIKSNQPYNLFSSGAFLQEAANKITRKEIINKGYRRILKFEFFIWMGFL